MNKYLTLIAAAALMAACSNEADQTEEQAVGQPIAVTVDEGSLTRATGEISTASKLAEKGFGLFGLYTGKLTYENTSVSSDFMYNQKVIGSANATGGFDWTYSPVKYWPNSTDPETGLNYTEYVTFFAYAPYEATPKEDGRCIIGMSDKYDMGDPWINYRLAENPWSDTNPQVDLMYAIKTPNVGYDNLFVNQTKPLFDSKLSFRFKHALACIGDEITIQMDQDLAAYIDGYATITITGLSITYKNLTTKARLVLNSPSGPNWKEIISGELTTSRTLNINSTYVLSTEPQTISQGQGLFYIPLQIKGTDDPAAEITVNYEVKDVGGNIHIGSATTSFPLDLGLEGEKTGISLVINKDFDLLHLTYPLDNNSSATEPSYSRQWK